MKDNAPLAGLELFASSLYYDLGKGRISTATALERCLDRLRAQDSAVAVPAPASHEELLAIHEVVMNPQAVVINEADTFTVKMVKEFVLSAVQLSSVSCARCGGRCVEFTVPNDVWNIVVRLGGKEREDEYLCEACYREAVTLFVRAMPEQLSSTEPMNMPLMWLYTHCIAIGMTEKSDSGKPEDDIALFTIHLNDAAKKAASATRRTRPPCEADCQREECHVKGSCANG